MAWKYLVIKRGHMEVPYVFPETEDHNTTASLLCYGDVKESVLGAGFCNYGLDTDGNYGWSCWGKSVSLGILARVEDTEILNRMLNNRS